MQGDFGEAVYVDEILPSSGWRRCRLPFPICGAWTQVEAGKWVLPRPGRPDCQYSPVLLQNTMIGLLGSGNSSLREAIQDAVEEYCIGEEFDIGFDGETVACALSVTVTSEDGVAGSEMMRVLWCMTSEIWNTSGDT